MSSFKSKQSTDADKAQGSYQYEKPSTKRATKLDDDNDLIQELLSESPSDDDRSDNGLDDEYDASKAPILKLRDIMGNEMSQSAAQLDDIIPQYATQGGSEQIHSLTMNFLRSSNFTPQQLTKYAEQIKGDKEKIKVVKINFRGCPRLSDLDLKILGAALGSRLGHVEYLYLDFLKGWRCTSYGIQEFIKGISGENNSIKCLRLRLRRFWNIGNKSIGHLLGGIRNDLVNLEELLFITAGNIWVTQKGIKAARENDSYSRGLRKFEVRHHWMIIMSLVKDDSAKDMARYIKKLLAEKDVREGTLVSNKIWFTWNRVWSNKVNTCKVGMEGNKNLLEY